MTIRTIPIADAILWTENRTGPTIFIEYEPGNGTRYICTITELDLTARALPALGFSRVEPAGVFMFAWLNKGRAHAFRNDGYLAPGYVAEKLNCGLADGAVLAELIAHYTGRTADNALDTRPGVARA